MMIGQIHHTKRRVGARRTKKRARWLNAGPASADAGPALGQRRTVYSGDGFLMTALIH